MLPDDLPYVHASLLKHALDILVYPYADDFPAYCLHTRGHILMGLSYKDCVRRQRPLQGGAGISFISISR